MVIPRRHIGVMLARDFFAVPRDSRANYRFGFLNLMN
jgi:hypothetical protein